MDRPEPGAAEADGGAGDKASAAARPTRTSKRAKVAAPATSEPKSQEGKVKRTKVAKTKARGRAKARGG
jgi:hypothetical protein